MASDPIAAYQEAIKSFETATTKAVQMMGIIFDGGDALGRRGQGSWEKVTVANVGVEFPSDMMGGPSIDGHLWPSGAQLGEVLAGWHAARMAVEAAYRQIPEASQEVLKPPSAYLGPTSPWRRRIGGR